MKKNNLWKAIGICFIAYVILTWIIPVGSFSSSTLSKGTTEPLGFIDMIRYPLLTGSTSLFVLIGIVMLLIGGFYGVLNQTGVYANVVNKIAKKYKEKKNVFVVISILVFAVLSSLTALTIPLFIMVPFFVAVILSLGYSKIVAMLSTVGAILVGNMASTYGFNINGYLSYFFGTNIHDTILTRFLFLAVATGAFIYFTVHICAKKNDTKNESKVEIPLYQNHVDKKKSAVPMVVIAIVMMLLILVGMYNWEIGLNIEFFNNIHSAIMDFKIAGYPLFKNIIGEMDPMGYWTNYEFAIIIFLVTLLIAWIYNIKGKEKWKAFVDGAKEMVPVALYAIIANIIFLLMNSSSAGATIFNTIANFFMTLTKGFNVFSFGVLSAIGGIFYNDFPFMINSLYNPITSLYKDFTFISMLTQMIHGFVMLIVPTSVLLVAGLRYFNISYTEWLKNIWKYLILAFVAIAIFIVLLLLLA